MDTQSPAGSSAQKQREMFDAGVTCMAFTLATHDIGLAAVILGIFDEEKIRSYLPLAENERITNLIA